MNKQPVYYWQTDKRWSKMRYPCNGGDISIGGGGCGETCAAMLITTITGKEVLPTDTMLWASKHGYLYAGQGTAYEYFHPQFAEYGIDCNIVTWEKCLDSHSWIRGKVEQLLKQGYYIIALMKKGLWTNGGHYVVAWWEDDKVRINDPASTRTERLNGDPDTFYSQAKYFWAVDAKGYIKEDDDMDVSKLTGEQCYEILLKANEYAGSLATPDWMKPELDKAIKAGITDGERPLAMCMRGQAAMMTLRGQKNER